MPTSILLISDSTKTFWRTLEYALVQGGFSIYKPGFLHGIPSILQKQQPDVLLFDAGENSFDGYLRFVGQYTRLSLVGLNPVKQSLELKIGNLSLETLKSLLMCCGVQGEKDGKNSRALPVQMTTECVDPDFQKRHPEIESHSLTTKLPAQQEQIISYDENWLYSWLDIIFALALMPDREPQTSSPNLIPGTLGHEQAWELLPESVTCHSEHELLALREELEGQLFRSHAGSDITDTTAGKGLWRLATIYQLSIVQQRALLIVASPDLAGRYARIVGYLHDDLTRRRCSLALVTELLQLEAGAAHNLLHKHSSLQRYQLLMIDEGAHEPRSTAALWVADDVVNSLLYPVEQVFCDEPGLQFFTVGDCIENEAFLPLHHRLLAWKAGKGSNIRLHQGLNDQDRFISECTAAGITVVLCDAGLLSQQHYEQLWADYLRAVRVAKWLDAVLLITANNFSVLPGQFPDLHAWCISRLFNLFGHIAIQGEAVSLCSGNNRVVWLENSDIQPKNRLAQWMERSEKLHPGLLSFGVLAPIARSIRFSSREIDQVLSQMSGMENSPEELRAELRQGVKQVVLGQTPGLVNCLEPDETADDWGQLVVPDGLRRSLRQIVEQVSYSGQVLDDWDFASRSPYGHGVTALFSGPSGTGKTMTARIIARQLNSFVYQIDLSKVVSKWLGETSNALRQIFSIAEKTGAVLLFDEADALFGKRTEIRDAHDRYANVEVSYLLQRIEAYSGVVLLTTNLRQNIDEAFLRRLRFICEFPLPGADDRLLLWQRAFPDTISQLMKENDPALFVELIPYLAQRLEITGGNIQQIALRAAFTAAGSKPQVIQRQHILQAAQDELLKLKMHSMAGALETRLQAWKKWLGKKDERILVAGERCA